MTVLVYAMIYAGAALMAYNIYSYVDYTRHLLKNGDWDRERRFMTIPIALLSFFLLGYLAAAFFGEPDMIFASILFFGSVFVFVMLLFLRRVTDRIKEHEQLRAKLMAAEESSRTKSNFLSNMSHEIRTPMNAIVGIDSIALRDPDLSPEIRGQFEKIDASAKHMLELVNDILDMSRIESGDLGLKEEDFGFADLIDQLNAVMRSKCRKKEIEYGFELRGDPASRYVADALKLRQLLLYVLDNAVKFTPEGGKVSFLAEVSEGAEGCDDMRFTVTDNGIGIDPEFLPHIFEPFTQENSTSTSSFGGSGLGMSLTKALVDMMGGSVAVDSEKGRGSTFVITLSLRRDPGADGAEGEEEREQVSLEGRHVLIVEDIEINAEILAELLSMEGITSEWAENGLVGVEKFSNSEVGRFDAVLMDLRMPVMDGLTATREIRNLPREDAKDVPIIALTANAHEEDVDNCLQAGMGAHLSKPADIERVLDTIRRLLNK